MKKLVACSILMFLGLTSVTWAEKDSKKKAVNCPISKKAVSKDVFVEVNGQKTFFCCKGCVKPYETKVLKVVDAGPAKCPKSGRPSKAATGLIHRTAKTVAFCCNNCQKGYMKKNSLVAKTVEKCPLSSKPGKADQFVIVNGKKQLFCCGNCKKGYTKKLAISNAKAELKCPLSGKSGKESTAIVHVKHKKVYFCCNGCKGKYSAKHFAKAKGKKGGSKKGGAKKKG